ncbi:MAG: MoaD/ThiS family protein [Candidatus Odinarchaeota archaeon]
MVVSIRVKLFFFASIREMVGRSELDISAAGNKLTVKELLELINHISFADKRKIFEEIVQRRIKLIINGKTVNNIQVDKIYLEDGDQLVFLPPFGGG